MKNQRNVKVIDFLSIQHTKYLRSFLAARLHKTPKTIHKLFSKNCYAFVDRLANGYLNLLALHLITFPKSRVNNVAVGDIIFLPTETGKLLELMKVIEVSPQGKVNYYTTVCLDKLTQAQYDNLMERIKK